MTVEKREKVRDGEGTATFVHCVEGKGAVQKNTNLLAEITLPPGASIGYHPHNEETEFYIILEGSGVVNDNGQEVAIKPGDTMVTGNGAFHSIANTGSVPLKMIAAIIKG
jgi:mannose-6-phosphate isomerase-like protein (cupin superfamily)